MGGARSSEYFKNFCVFFLIGIIIYFRGQFTFYNCISYIFFAQNMFIGFTIIVTILILLYLTYLFKIFSFSLEDNFLINSVSKLLTSHIILFRVFQNYFLVFVLAMSIIVVTDFISTLFLRRIYIIRSISLYSYLALTLLTFYVINRVKIINFLITAIIPTSILFRLKIFAVSSSYFLVLVPFLAISHTTYFLKNRININWYNFLAPTMLLLIMQK